MNEKKHVENEIVKKTPVTESAVEKDIGKEREYAVSANDLLGKLKGNIGVLKQRKNSSAGTAIPEENEVGNAAGETGESSTSDKVCEINESDFGNMADNAVDFEISDKSDECAANETDKSGMPDSIETEPVISDSDGIEQIFKAADSISDVKAGETQSENYYEYEDDESTKSEKELKSVETENVSDGLSDVLPEAAEGEPTAQNFVNSDDIENTEASASETGEPFDDFDSDDSVDDTDVQLMVAFGMDDELVQTVGLDKAAELSENADKTGKLILPKEKKKEREEVEFTSSDQIKSILSNYKAKYRLLLLRLLGGGLLLIFSFLFENLSEFGAKLPNWMDSRTYPVVYTMLGFQLLVLAAVLVKDRLVEGYRSFSRFQLTPDSALFIVTAFSAVYEVLMCILHFHAVGDKIRFFNFPVILMIFISLIGEYMDLKREIFSFNVIASKKHKFAIESLSEKQATLETAAFAGFMPENSSIFRIAETEFVDGFYSRMKTSVSLRRVINVLLPLSFGAAIVFFIWNLIIERSVSSALTVAEYTLIFGVPFITMLVFSYPFYSASKRAYKIGSAVIGGSSLEEYSCTSSAITFEDKDVFPASGVMVKSIKTYGDSRIDYIIYNVASLFMKVGGPLAEVFESATRDLEHTEDVKLTRVVAGGLEAYISGEHVYCGSFDFFAENGLNVPGDPEDEALLDDGAVSIMLLAIDGEVVAKLYVQYMFDRDFEVTIKQFSRLGICVGIKTFDPNITDEMLNRKIRLSDYPIKVLRCRTIDDLSVSSEHVESGVVSKKSVKSMMQAYSLCEKVLHAMKSGIMLKILSMAFAFLIVALVLLFGVGGEICSYHAALYQLIWVVPAIFITRLYVTKN